MIKKENGKPLNTEEREALEGEYTAYRIIELQLDPVQGNFDAAHLREINRRIFQDLPELGLDDVTPGQYRPPAPAGKDWIKHRVLETVGEASHVAYSSMDKAAQARLETVLKQVNPAILGRLETSEFAQAIGKLYAELDYIHPFPDGNSRTLREFTRQLGQEAGYIIEWERFHLSPAGRDILYIARDRSVNELALPHINFAGTKRDIILTMDRFEGNRDLPNLLRDVIQPIQVASQKKDIDLIPAQTLEPLSAAALAERVSENSNVKSLRKNVEQLAKLVYGRADALSQNLASISQNPKAAEALTNRIGQAPETIAPLAGSASLLGKDTTRKIAEANIYKLGQVIEDYGNAVKRAGEEISQTHDKEQKRLAQSVPQPAKSIKQLLNMPMEQRKEALEKSPHLQEELQSFVDKLHSRLSPDERKAMVEGNHGKLAKSLGVTEAQAKQIGATVNAVKTVQRDMARAAPVRGLSK